MPGGSNRDVLLFYQQSIFVNSRALKWVVFCEKTQGDVFVRKYVYPYRECLISC